MNPLRGFISAEGHLFEELDSKKEGIRVLQERGVLTSLFDCVFGKACAIDVAGDVVVVDKESAEDFFARNKHLFEGRDLQAMAFEDKVLYLLKRNKKLPLNISEEEAVGGEEAKRTLYGNKRKFLRVVQGLQKNAFEVSRLLQLIEEKEEGFVSIEREEFFRSVVEENKGRIEALKDTCGDARIRRLAHLLIKNINKKLFS